VLRKFHTTCKRESTVYQPIGTLPVCVEVVITAADSAWLADLTHALVDDRIVACGHTITPIRATYRRDDGICNEDQTRVSLHTRATLVDDIIARVNGDHPDAVPNVVATQLTDGHPDYLQWIIDETAGAIDHRATTDARRPERAGGRWHWGHSRYQHRLPSPDGSSWLP
jgi:periplasmic divalent cation tolerance protein